MNIDSQGGFLISKIKHLSGRIFARMLREYDIEINPAQGRIMFVLWQNDPLPIHELSHQTALSKSTLTSMLDRLEEAGFIVRERSKTDRRVILIRRTPKDKALQETYEAVSREMSRIYLEGFTQAETDSLERLLMRVLENLQKHEGSNHAAIE